MKQNKPFEGDLKQVPLFALMRRIQMARATGSLRVCRESEERHLVFDGGELLAARSSRLEHSLGHSLVQWGYVTSEEVGRALEAQSRAGGRLGAVLVELGYAARSVVEAEARRLMEQIVSSALSWPEGRFEFVPSAGGESGEDIAVQLSVTAMIVEGIRRVPESERFVNLLGDLSRVPHRVSALASQLETAALPDEAAGILRLADGERNARALLDAAPGSNVTAAKVLFTMAYCGFVEMRDPARARPVGIAASAAPRRSFPNAPGPRDHRSKVMSTWLRIDWLSDYDLLGVSTGATRAEIADAYRRLSALFDPALRHRPDLADCGRQLTVLSQRAREAYDTLNDPIRRAALDARIQESESQLGSPMELTDVVSGSHLSPDARREMASSNYERAVALIGENDVFPAIEMLAEAVRLAPDVPKYRLLLGQSKMRNRWWRDEALEQLAEAVRLDPKCAEGQASLAEVYLDLGDPISALPHARMAASRAAGSQKDGYQRLAQRAEEAAAAQQGNTRPRVQHSA
ncbi:MAG: DUF4388 domain-containing protein [Acidobacteriota bacterium]